LTKIITKQEITLKIVSYLRNEDFTWIISKQQFKPFMMLFMTDVDFSYKKENIQEFTRSEIIKKITATLSKLSFQ